MSADPYKLRPLLSRSRVERHEWLLARFRAEFDLGEEIGNRARSELHHANMYALHLLAQIVGP